MNNSGTQISDHATIQAMQMINPWGNMFNQNLQPVNSIPATRGIKISALQRTLGYQKTPYSEPTQVSKGLTTSNAGGSFILYDKTGGTEIFTYNPHTGVVTINGSLIAQSSNTGTYTNIVLSGTNQINGTQMMGFYGTPQILGGTYNNALLGTPQLTGGTVNPSVYQTGGTVGFTGSIVFVRNTVGPVIGTMTFSNGLLIGTS